MPVFFCMFLASHKQTCVMLNIYKNNVPHGIDAMFSRSYGCSLFALSFSRPLHDTFSQKSCACQRKKCTARGIFSARVQCYLHRFHPPTSSQSRRIASKCGMIQLIDTRRAINNKCKTDAFCRRPLIRIDANCRHSRREGREFNYPLDIPEQIATAPYAWKKMPYH